MAHFLVTQLLCGHQSNIRLASGFENIYKNRNSNLTAKFCKNVTVHETIFKFLNRNLSHD